MKTINKKYFWAAENAWKLIFGFSPRGVCYDCRRGIAGAKVLGEPTVLSRNGKSVFISGLRGEFHALDLAESRQQGFFVKYVRVEEGWVDARDILKYFQLPSAYVSI